MDELTLPQMDTEVMGGSDTLVSKLFSVPRPVLAIRLHTVEILTIGGSTSYEYSMDGGASWHASTRNKTSISTRFIPPSQCGPAYAEVLPRCKTQT